MFSFSTLAILLPVSIFLHVTEEFLFPGGFSEWYNKLVPPKTSRGIDMGYLVWINTLMIGVCVFPLYYGDTSGGMSIWYCISLSAAINACFHIWGVLKLRIYSPGIITALFCYIPLFIIGSVQLLLSGIVPVRTIIICTIAAVAYHIFSVFRQGR